MQSIIAAERQILGDVTKKDVTTIPQVWTLYKEVQRYWDQGLRAPDDVTVVFTDDNWGNIRKLPDLKAPKRSGGYGLYYHFDYVGGGRNYKWVDTSQLPNIWDQLNQAHSYGVDRLWVINVGDLKNDELPTQFFLDYAWNPDRWPVEKPRRLGASVRGAELRAGAGGGHRRRPAHLRRAAVAAQAGAAQPPDQPRPEQGPRHGLLGGALRRPGQPVQPHQLPRDGQGHGAVAGAGGEGRADRPHDPGGLARRLLRARALRGQGDRQPLRAAQRGVHEHPLRQAGAGRDQRPGGRDRGPLRRRPGDVGLLQQHPRRREVEGLPDPAAHRLRRRGQVRPQRAVAAARAQQRRAEGRHLPRGQADRRAGRRGHGRGHRRV